MIINFRQGIITYPTSSNQQVFLAKVGNYVNLQTANGRTDITFAYGTEDYLFTESTDTNNAWGPLLANTDYWLFWDIDLLTATRTFGFTTLAPIVSSIQPTGVNNQHWFNLVDNKMYVFENSAWRAVLRTFAARVNNAIFTTVGANVLPRPFAGSQVGLNTPNTKVGRITVDDVGRPILKSDGTFFTSEDDYFVNGSPVNALRPESSIFNATAIYNIAKYQVVKFTKFGKVGLAAYNDLQTDLIAMSLEDMAVNETGSLCLQGVVNNPLWSFTTVGAQLWVSTAGGLTDVDPHILDPITYKVAKVAVGRVLSPTSIYFTQGLGAKGDAGTPPLASETTFGISKLSFAAADVDNPIVVGDNDPRLIPGTLDSLSDVIVPTPTTNDLLKFNGTNWVNSPAPAPTLDGLSDVVVPTPTPGDLLEWNGTNWVNIPPLSALPYDLAFYIPSNPFDINAIVSGFLSPRAITIASGALNIAKASIPASTTQTIFTFKKQGSQVATITFNVGATIGTIVFTAGNPITVAVGDALTINTTGTIDSVIAGIGITFVGISSFV